MKVLFIIQGEGRGHLTQAMTMERLLMSHGHEVVGMLVGKSESRKLPAFLLIMCMRRFRISRLSIS